MNQEIKFRAWYKPQKKMIMPNELESINFETKVLGVYLPIEDDVRFHTLRMSDFELMQYTGLRDSKRTEEYPEGQEIYEGDILNVLEVSNTKESEYRSPVEFIESGFLVTQPDDYQVPLACFHNPDTTYPLFEIEVIGNIHEHAHLLEKAK